MDRKTRCFQILNVSPSASSEEIRQAFLDLVRIWHPDRFASDPRLQKFADEKLKEITEAYQGLSPDEPARDSSRPSAAPRPQRAPRNPGAWLSSLAYSLTVAIVLLFVGAAIYSFAFPPRNAFMLSEIARIARLFGPEPAMPPAVLDPKVLRPPRTAINRKTAPAYRPENGADLTAPRGTTGWGEFQIRNESDQDCILRVMERNSPASPARTIYLHGQATSSIQGLSPGIYRLLVGFGRDWNSAEAAFGESDSPEFWIGPFEFFQTESSAERQGLRYTIGLKPIAQTSDSHGAGLTKVSE